MVKPTPNFDKDLLDSKLGEFDHDMLRIPAIAREFIRGFTFFRNRKNFVTVFGSARLAPAHPYCQQAKALGSRLAAEKVGVITGGGPGIMSAANQGCYESGGTSIGVNILLETEQHPNPYLSDYILMEHFFARKLLLVKYSSAIVVFPGGFGTIDELFEVLTLVQTRKLEMFPIVLMGLNYWQGLIDWVKDEMVSTGTIKATDVDLITATDDLDQAIQIIRNNIP